MTRARDFADVISGQHNLPLGSLGNAVPAGSITTAKLANDAVNASKIADGVVRAQHIADGHVTTAKLADDAITSAKIATNAVASDALNIARSDLPSGTVLQCVTTNYPDDFAFSLNASGSAADNGKMHRVPGLDTSITPTSTSSKILYQATIYLGGNLVYDIGYHVIKNATATTATTSSTDTSPCGGSYLTDSSGNALRGQASNNNPRSTGVANFYQTVGSAADPSYMVIPVSMSLLDHPNTTSQITYNFAIAWYNWHANALYVNRSNENQQSSTGTYDTNPVSTVTLMEIA